MKLSLSGFKRICCFEAFVPVSYRDGGTDTHPRFSWGFGGLAPGPDATIELRRAFEFVKEHCDPIDKAFRFIFGEALHQHEWDAIISLTYQGGSPPMRAVEKRIHADDPDWANEFANWDKDKITRLPVKGLTWRRQTEMMLAKHADYGDIAQFKAYAGNPKAGPVSVHLTDWPDYLAEIVG